MKILIKSEEKTIRLFIPLGFLKTGLAKKMICKNGNEKLGKIMENKGLIKSLIKELKKHKGLKLVEVRSSDDADVDIII